MTLQMRPLHQGSHTNMGGDVAPGLCRWAVQFSGYISRPVWLTRTTYFRKCELAANTEVLHLCWPTAETRRAQVVFSRQKENKTNKPKQHKCIFFTCIFFTSNDLTGTFGVFCSSLYFLNTRFWMTRQWPPRQTLCVFPLNPINWLTVEERKTAGLFLISWSIWTPLL